MELSKLAAVGKVGPLPMQFHLPPAGRPYPRGTKVLAHPCLLRKGELGHVEFLFGVVVSKCGPGAELMSQGEGAPSIVALLWPFRFRTISFCFVDTITPWDTLKIA